MIGLAALKDVVSLCIHTGQVAGERPASMIVVAPPGAGKTSILEAMTCDHAPYASDLTSRDISRILKGYKEATHIILGDMMSLFGHKMSVIQLSCRVLSSLTGEELRTDSFSGEEMKGRMMGLITAIPPDDFDSKRIQEHMTAGGFASRFMVVKYAYHLKTIQEIHKYIREDRYVHEQKTAFRVNGGKRAISVPDDVAQGLQDLAIVIKQDPIGTRMHHHLRALVKAHALRAGRDSVTREDLEHVTNYCDFFLKDGRLI